MGREHTNFLQNYKKIETCLRESNMTVQELEDKLEPSDSQRLRMCRCVRNFLTHEADGDKFVAITDEMVKFVDSLLVQLDDSNRSVTKKMLSASKCLVESDTLAKAAAFIQKYDVSSVCFLSKKTGAVAGVISTNDILCAVSQGISVKTLTVKKLWDDITAKRKHEYMKCLQYFDVNKTIYDAEVEHQRGCSYIIITKNGVVDEPVLGIYV